MKTPLLGRKCSLMKPGIQIWKGGNIRDEVNSTHFAHVLLNNPRLRTHVRN